MNGNEKVIFKSQYVKIGETVCYGEVIFQGITEVIEREFEKTFVYMVRGLEKDSVATIGLDYKANIIKDDMFHWWKFEKEVI